MVGFIAQPFRAIRRVARLHPRQPGPSLHGGDGPSRPGAGRLGGSSRLQGFVDPASAKGFLERPPGRGPPGRGRTALALKNLERGDDDAPGGEDEEHQEQQFPVFMVVAATVLCAELVFIGLCFLAQGRTALTSELLHRASSAAAAGVAAAFVAGLWSAVLEPVMNRIFVLGLGFSQAVWLSGRTDRGALFRSSLATNLVKVPFFEAVFAALRFMKLPLPARALVAAAAYTTVALPTVNYLYRKSVGLKLRASDLYAAFLPTFYRDLVYCLARAALEGRFAAAGIMATSPGCPALHRFLVPFCGVFVGCLAASPGNEYRGFVLNKRSADPKPWREFFDWHRFARTSLVGAGTMASIVGTGYLLTPVAEGVQNILWQPASLSAPTGVWLALGLVVGLSFGRWKPGQERYRFDRYAQQRQLVFLRLAQESENLQVRPRDARRDGEASVGPVVEPEEASAAAGSAGDGAAGPMALQIVRFVLPACGLVAANQAMTAVDKAFVGRISSLQLAAMGSAATSFDCISYVTTFINTASLNLLGLALASDDRREADRVRSHALVFAGGLGAFLAATMTLFADPLCRIVGGARRGPMLDAATGYLVFRALGIPVERLISVGTTFCLAAKDGATPLVVTAIGSAANVLFDWYFCTRFRGQAAAAAAGASALAAGVSFLYLLQRLRAKGRWPRPLLWPRGRDFRPFLDFAGPVFLLLLIKSVTFAQMTNYASGLGTTLAAAHQIYLSLLFLTAVACGTPLSWAAQSFMPEFLMQGQEAGTPGSETEAARKSGKAGGAASCLNALVAVSVGCALVAGLAVLLSLQQGIGILTSDKRVVMALRAPKAVVSLMGFVLLYPVFLALEGTLIAAQKLTLPLILSSMMLVCNTGLFHLLKRSGWLSLSMMWATASGSLLLATVCSALLAACVCAGRKGAALRPRSLEPDEAQK